METGVTAVIVLECMCLCIRIVAPGKPSRSNEALDLGKNHWNGSNVRGVPRVS